MTDSDYCSKCNKKFGGVRVTVPAVRKGILRRKILEEQYLCQKCWSFYLQKNWSILPG